MLKEGQNGAEKVSTRVDYRLFKGSGDIACERGYGWAGLSKDRGYGADVFPLAQGVWRTDGGLGETF